MYLRGNWRAENIPVVAGRFVICNLRKSFQDDPLPQIEICLREHSDKKIGQLIEHPKIRTAPTFA